MEEAGVQISNRADDRNGPCEPSERVDANFHEAINCAKEMP
jgi:hypothetical protein